MLRKIIFSSFIFISLSSSIVFTQRNLPTIGIVIYRYDDNFMTFVRRDIERILKGKARVMMTDSYNSQATQNDQIDSMISKGAKALAVNLVNPQAAQSVIDKAMEKDIPIVFFNKEPDESAMKSYDKVWYVGTKSEEAGNIQGRIVVESWKSRPKLDKNGDEKMQYVLLKGEPGHQDAEARTKYVKDYIAQNGIRVQQLEESSAMWEKDKAKDIMKSWMDKYGNKIEFIIANNDAMALGALEVIKELGYNEGDIRKYIPIVGVDAIPEALEEIKNGNMVGTVLQSPISQANAVAGISLNVASGKNSTDGTDFILDDSKSVRIPYIPVTINNIAIAEEVYK